MPATTLKSSVSFQPSVWNHLKKERNRSALINRALELYFEREKFLKKADEWYWKRVEASLKGESDDYTSLNPNDEPVTDQSLEEKLWN